MRDRLSDTVINYELLKNIDKSRNFKTQVSSTIKVGIAVFVSSFFRRLFYFFFKKFISNRRYFYINYIFVLQLIKKNCK